MMAAMWESASERMYRGLLGSGDPPGDSVQDLRCYEREVRETGNTDAPGFLKKN